MPSIFQPEVFCREKQQVTTYLLLGIKLRIIRRALKETQAVMARRFGMSLPEYKKVEEAQHAPDSEKTLKIVGGGLPGLTPYDARTRVSSEIVDILLPRSEREDAGA